MESPMVESPPFEQIIIKIEPKDDEDVIHDLTVPSPTPTVQFEPSLSDIPGRLSEEAQPAPVATSNTSNFVCPRLRTCTTYKCCCCDSEFETHAEYKEHTPSHRTDAGYGCKECDSFFETIELVFLHMCNEHLIRVGPRFICPYDGESCSTFNMWGRHTRAKHKTDKGYCCDGCQSPFRSMRLLVAHLRRDWPDYEAGDRLWSNKCEFCDEEFSNQDIYMKHLLVAHERIIVCKMCNTSFLEPMLYIGHRVECFHGTGSVKKSGDSSGKVKASLPAKKRPGRHKEFGIICEKCGKSFKTSYKYRGHLSDIKPYHCEICDKYFLTASIMKNHKLRHNVGVRNYLCDLCSLTFYTRSDLGAHKINKHPTTFHKCEVCAKEFKTTYSFNQHMMVHTGEKKYECDICQKRFRLASSCREHRLVHTGEKPIECKVCHRFFRKRSTLRTHMKRHRDK